MTIERVVYVGNFRVPWATEVHLADTLSRMGYQVDRVQEDETDVADIEGRGLRSDLVLYTRTWGLPKEAIDLWRRLEDRGVQTASYHLDLYHGLSRQAGVAGDPFWSTNFCFTPDGDPAAQAWFEEQGINHHWIRPGVYGPECTPGRPDHDSFPHQIVFVGSWKNYHREWPHRKRLVQHLMRGKFRKQVGVWGHEGRGTIRGMPLNDLYATATVVVGDSLCPNYTKPNYVSDRCYETVGRGGYLLHPNTPGLELQGGAHLDIYPYGDFKTLDTMIERALDDPAGCRERADAGQEYVRNNCTYEHRLREALETIENG